MGLVLSALTAAWWGACRQKSRPVTVTWTRYPVPTAVLFPYWQGNLPLGEPNSVVIQLARPSVWRTSAAGNGLASAFCPSADSFSRILPGETQADFDELCQQTKATFAPITAEETLLTDQLTESLWHLNRPHCVESQAYPTDHSRSCRYCHPRSPKRVD